MSMLLQGQADGQLTPEEVSSQCILLLIGGHITTVDQLGNTVLALLQHPEQMGHLRDNPELVRSAIEEGLRYDGTAQLTQRVAREDLVVRGKTIRRGEMLQLALGAANRDPEVFVEPDRFEISRAHNPHLAFGSGSHQCLGMNLGPARTRDLTGATGAADATAAPRQRAADAAAHGQPGAPRAGIAAGPLRLTVPSGGRGAGSSVSGRTHPSQHRRARSGDFRRG